MVQTQAIREELKSASESNNSISVSESLDNSDFDYIVEKYGTFLRVYAFEVETMVRVDPAVQLRETADEGVLVFHILEEDSIYAVGVSEYDNNKTDAFHSLTGYF